MPTSVAQAPQSQATRTLDHATALLTKDHVPYAPLAHALDNARSACAANLLEDFPLASAEKIEDRLWNVHLKANTHFRVELRKLKEGGNSKVVERRKLSADYLKFIKSSQRFFRNYIRNLDHAFGGITELHRLCGKLGATDENKLAQPSKAGRTVELDLEIVQSAYRTLVQLGDLSRYRESELSEHTPNWSFAVGYYDLARSIVPASGVAFNQLAIVALADGNLFQATYYLFRSLSASERHPQAESNLRKAFFKISGSWEKGELVQSASALVAWHLRLVSKCFHGKPFAEHDELEKEVSSRLRKELINVSLESTVRKLFLINFAACFSAQKRFTAHPNTEENFLSYTYFLRLSLSCVCTLFKCMLEQLRDIQANGHSANSTRVPGNVRKLFPFVRLSTLWITKNVRVLTNSVSPDIDKLQSELWDQLTHCLAAALSGFGVDDLPESNHLLEEDEDTVAFEPLLCDQTRGTWYQNGSLLKVGRQDVDENLREANLESLSRIRMFLKAGIQFALDERFPLQYDLDQATFERDRGPASNAIHTAESGSDESSSRCVPPPIAQPASDEDKDAERMVSSLVGAEQMATGPDISEDSQPVGPYSLPTGPHTANEVLLTMQHYPNHPLRRDSGNALMRPSRVSPRQSAHRDTNSTGLHQPVSSLYLNHAGRQGSRPGSGSDAERAFNAAVLMTPERGIPQDIIGGDTRPHGGPLAVQTDTSHSRGHSVDSNHSHHSIWTPNGSRGSLRPPANPAGSGNGAMASVMGLGNGTFGGQDWAGSGGMGSSLLFGAGNSPWTMSGQETKRMSAGSPRIPASPGLRRDSGPSPGAIGSGRSLSRPAS